MGVFGKPFQPIEMKISFGTSISIRLRIIIRIKIKFSSWGLFGDSWRLYRPLQIQFLGDFGTGGGDGFRWNEALEELMDFGGINKKNWSFIMSIKA